MGRSRVTNEDLLHALNEIRQLLWDMNASTGSRSLEEDEDQHAAATSRPGESPGEPSSRSDRLNAAAEGLLASVPEAAAEQARLAKRAMQDRAERTRKRQP